MENFWYFVAGLATGGVLLFFGILLGVALSQMKKSD